MKQFILATILFLTGCASLMSVNSACKLNDPDPAVTALMQKSCQGDQYASFQLGNIYERRAAASGSDTDWSHALNFYRSAAQPNAGQTFIYIPGAGKVAGYTMPVQTGSATLGVAEAQYRLGEIYMDGKGVKANIRKAHRFLEMAAKQGHKEADQRLAQMNQE